MGGRHPPVSGAMPPAVPIPQNAHVAARSARYLGVALAGTAVMTKTAVALATGRLAQRPL